MHKKESQIPQRGWFLYTMKNRHDCRDGHRYRWKYKVDWSFLFTNFLHHFMIEWVNQRPTWSYNVPHSLLDQSNYNHVIRPAWKSQSICKTNFFKKATLFLSTSIKAKSMNRLKASLNRRMPKKNILKTNRLDKRFPHGHHQQMKCSHKPKQ